MGREHADAGAAGPAARAGLVVRVRFSTHVILDRAAVGDDD